MGESKKRRASFLSEHPLCCYCGGNGRATTVDHAPARVCFKGKVGPESYEFPSCQNCNSESSLSETISAFWIRMTDTSERYFDPRETDKLISAMANNAPQCLPDIDLSANSKRRLLRERGLKLPAGGSLKDLPVVGIPDAVHPHLDLLGRKMLAAIYYRETGKILGPDHSLILRWSQIGSEASAYSRDRANAWFGKLKVGARRNTDIGEQFIYQYGYHENHRFFGLSMEFSSSLNFFLIAGPADQLSTLDHQELVHRWEPVSDFARRIKVEGSRRNEVPS